MLPTRKVLHSLYRSCPAGLGCGNSRAKLPPSPGSPPAISEFSSGTRRNAWISAMGIPFWEICPSSQSDSSYDFLSAEEKECLLFLEETIGSLDTEADSGLSTDESEKAATPQSPRELPITQPAPQGHPEEKILLQPSLGPRRVTQSSSRHLPEPQGLGLRSGSYSLPRNIHISRNQNLRKNTTQTNSHLPAKPEGFIPDPEKGQVSQSSEANQAPAGPWEPLLWTQHSTPHQRLSESPSQSSVGKTASVRGQGSRALDLDTALIPPPEAFRDAQPEQCGEDGLPEGPGEQSPTPQLHTLLSSQKRKDTSSEVMSQKPSERGSMGAPGQSRPPPAMSSQNSRAADAPIPSGGNPNAHLAPLTAPKPRKLPPNIVLKSSRSSFHSNPQNWLSRHSEAAPGDSGLVPSSLQEQRKARKEALEKLGLPQDQDEPSPQLSKPTSSIRLKGTHAQAPAPAPAQPAFPTQVSAAVPVAEKASAPVPTQGPSPVKAPAPEPALAQGPFPGKVLVPAQEPTPGKVPAAKSMPISIPKAPGVSSPLSQPKPNSGLTLQESNIPGLRQMNFKSNTLERSGVGLSSYLSAEKEPSPQTSTSLGKGSFLNKISPNVLRNSRPRPASLGTGKDFAGIQVGKLADLEQEQSSKHLSYQGQSRDKLPRPPCVSVKISPKGIPDEHRREALRKLGLLKE
ncbi:specifically androgen-regulated gene protein isoform X2 [Pteropus vampyrus]|uniref:Specifically androgen-regulated gene protein isoform X2 n=1 Tax=Pteropus vampyrus TaxID=132908 RepID=A0A6P6C2M0_PTEVA|nr:specifically androgen-regulated gene protein isoform X2 [Pteropus vampyrus]